MMEILIGPERTPWLDFPPSILGIVAAQARMKHDLIPYLRSALFTATRTGMPVIRPLLLAYPRDEAARDLSDQYLYGPELLVAPVVEKGAQERALYLPEGRWLDDHDRTTVHAGGRTIRAQAPLSRIPVFVREGAIIPRGDVLRANNTWSENWTPRLRVEVFPSARIPSEAMYYTGRRTCSIASQPTPSGFRLDVDDLEVRAELAVVCHRPDAVISAGTPLVEGKGYTYDPGRHLLVIPVTGPARLDVRGAAGASRALSVF
jgi:alpha-glucosidase (family GH31 glycosyl hydrolase)